MPIEYSLKLFISHSSHDSETARSIINLVKAALNLKPEEIRCTSVDGYRLPVGADTDERLRKEILAADAFVGIISPASIASAYVLFELGGRWGAGKPLAPILAPGVAADVLKGPLAGINVLSCGSESQLYQFVGDIAREVGCRLNSPAAYLTELKAVVSSGARDGKGATKIEDAEPSSDDRELSDLEPEVLSAVGLFVLKDGIAAASQLKEILSWSAVKTQHFIDELTELGYIEFNSKAGNDLYYNLTRKGRAFAVAHDLA